MDSTKNTKGTAASSASSSSWSESVTFVELLRLVISKWHWYIASLAVCLAVAFVYVSSQKPMYQRSATLLIKENNSRRTTRNELESIISAQNQISSKLVNEISVFQSPAIISEAVARLGLEVEYAYIGKTHDVILYGAGVPVVASFKDFAPNSTITFRMSRDAKGEISVKSISGSASGKPFEIGEVLKTTVGGSFETPAGVVEIQPNPYNPTPNWRTDLKVTKRSVAMASRSFIPRLNVSPENIKERSDILRISLTDFNIQRAEDLIKMIITVYNENWVEDQNKTAIISSMFIKDRLADIEKELAVVDEAISNFKSENFMPDVQSLSNMYMNLNTELTSQLRHLENQLSVAKYLRTYLANNYAIEDLIPIPSGLTDMNLSSQVSEYNKKVLQRNGIMQNSSSTNPLVMDIDRDLKALRGVILGTIDNQVNAINAQMDYLKTQEQKNSGMIAQSPNRAKALLSYERQQKVKESLYLFLLQKGEENQLSQAFTAYNTRLITPPYGSNSPVSPNSTKIMLIAILFGLALPTALLYLSQITNNRIRGRKDLEGLSYPFLGEIPQIFKRGDRKDIVTNLVIPKQKNRGDVDIMVKPGCRDLINESFRVLRANLEFMTKQNEHNVMLVTSYNPSSGKSFVAINLAVTLALNGLKVLIIDGDFRRYSISRTFHMKREHGFADYLTGKETDIHPYVQESGVQDNLFILPVGTVPPNPSELLAGEKFSKTIDVLKKEYQYIFIDSAPVEMVADTQVISPIADRTIFVVRAGLLERSLLSDLENLGEEKKYNNITVILNGTDINATYGSRYGSKYAYYYGRYGNTYGYGHHYGYGYGRTKNKDGAYYTYDDNKPVSEK